MLESIVCKFGVWQARSQRQGFCFYVLSVAILLGANCTIFCFALEVKTFRGWKMVYRGRGGLPRRASCADVGWLASGKKQGVWGLVKETMWVPLEFVMMTWEGTICIYYIWRTVQLIFDIGGCQGLICSINGTKCAKELTMWLLKHLLSVTKRCRGREALWIW